MTEVVASIVTAVHAEGGQYLPELYESIRAQSLPAASWEWLLQIDGDSCDWLPSGMAAGDPHVHIKCNAVHQGPAATRNLALSRARGRYVRNVDADDVITGGALQAAIEIAESRPEIGYVTGPVVDLFADGHTESFADDLPSGLIEPGRLYDAWTRRGYRGIVHPTCICIRTELLLAMGGWTALAGSEDTALLMAVSTVSQGWQLDLPVLKYRRHANQTTAEEWFRNEQLRDQRHGFIERRVAALRAAASRFPGEAPCREAAPDAGNMGRPGGGPAGLS